MKLLKKERFNIIQADDNKHIRDKSDVYKKEYIDENGNLVEEHFPYYSDIIYTPKNFSEEKMNEIYVEEVKE